MTVAITVRVNVTRKSAAKATCKYVHPQIQIQPTALQCDHQLYFLNEHGPVKNTRGAKQPQKRDCLTPIFTTKIIDDNSSENKVYTKEQLHRSAGILVPVLFCEMSTTLGKSIRMDISSFRQA